MRKTIADHVFDVLAEQQMNGICFGDLDQIHEAARRAGMYEKGGNTHPLCVIQKVLNGLERSNRFEKGYMKYDGKRPPCRAFRVKMKVIRRKQPRENHSQSS